MVALRPPRRQPGGARLWDANCLRYVESGALVKRDLLEARWKEGLYASTLFVPPPLPGKAWPGDYLSFLKTAPMVVAVSPGPEETFGYFSGMTPKQLDKLRADADYLRKATGKPVMVGHGGYWTRLEFEKVPFYDIYDPETEPLYPAPCTPICDRSLPASQGHLAAAADVRGRALRALAFHVFVELMRGSRGWQIAHGPGDASTFRGLHAEMTLMQPIVFSKEKVPAVRIEPPLEHMVRRHRNRTYVAAASTHGMSFGTCAGVRSARRRAGAVSPLIGTPGATSPTATTPRAGRRPSVLARTAFRTSSTRIRGRSAAS